ncbi:MAG: hypothetical protein AB7O26_05370 [Planctomycetaceae bacterium]
MSKHFVTSASIAVAMLFACVAISADEKEKEKDAKYKIVCPVSGQPGAKDHAVKYKGGDVYFCCDNCPKAFEKEPAKFALKANAQLVGTGQAKNVKCPLSGGKLNKEQFAEVDGVKVTFCCGNCKAKVEKAEGEKKSELVFSDAAFAKGFKVGAISKKEKKDKD